MECIKLRTYHFVYDAMTMTTYRHNGECWAVWKGEFHYLQDDFGNDAKPMTIYEVAINVEIDSLQQMIKADRQELRGDNKY